jgi:hypothetical protein
MISKSRLAMSIVAGLTLILIAVFGVSIKYQTMVNSIPVQIGVGMSSKDVESRIGKPNARTTKGSKLNPPHASGFVPDIQEWQYAQTYWIYGKVVYVFFDEMDRVIAFYVCTV